MVATRQGRDYKEDAAVAAAIAAVAAACEAKDEPIEAVVIDFAATIACNDGGDGVGIGNGNGDGDGNGMDEDTASSAANAGAPVALTLVGALAMSVLKRLMRS